jgi:hypothetical protein
VNIMKLISALVGLTALGGIALATAPASAMPIAVPGQVSQASNVEQVNYVCNEWGHCWHRHYYGGGYYQPNYYGGWHHWHPYNYGGWGYGGWHHWHPHYYGGWGYGGWHHWHHWHAWNQW